MELDTWKEIEEITKTKNVVLIERIKKPLTKIPKKLNTLGAV